MRLRRRAAMFRAAAVESMTLAVELFNRPSPVARDHAVVMMAAHSFEMLLKGIIFQARGTVREPGSEDSLSLGRCIDIAADDLTVLRPDERVVLRSLKQDRDAATHDVIVMAEELLWVHMRSAVTIFQRLSRDVLGVEEAALPGRVLPVSAAPPEDLGLLLDQEVEAVRQLLQPGRRRRDEAAARLRPLLALDGSATGRSDPPTDREVARAERALRAGNDWRTVLPGLTTLSVRNRPHPDASEIVLQVGKAPDAVPVRRAHAGEDATALAYRQSNPFDEFSIKLISFGERLGLSRQQGLAIVEHLELKDDDRAYFIRRNRNGNVVYQGLSARALHLARQALDDGLDVDAVTQAYNARRRPGAKAPPRRAAPAESA
ncbi:DUF3644 domain-containing protein [Geodermatophilus sp. SYSU D00684]